MAENDSLLREVDDAVRHDRLMALWNQFKMPLIYAAIALILVTAGSSIWKNYQQAQAEKITLVLEEAAQLYQSKQYDKAAASFETVTQQARGALADMARLWQARSLLGAQKEKSARRTLQNLIIAPEGHDLLWRDLACIHLMGLTGSIKEVPSACSGETASPLSTLLVRLRAAGLWQSGDAAAARKMLETLADDTTLSPDVRAQARGWETTIGAHGAKE